MKPKILHVRIGRHYDNYPDLSWLGKYCNRPETEWAIDRQARGDQKEDEYRWFNPGNHIPPGNPASWRHVTDEDIQKACESNGLLVFDDRQAMIEQLDLHYIEQDYQRMEANQRGDWHCVGVFASAEVRFTQGGKTQYLCSTGLWNIESDSSDDYFESIEQEELAGLRAELEAIGCGKRAIDYAFKHAEHKGDR